MNRDRGSALVETLVALLILASGLVSLASMFSVATGVHYRNQLRTTATLLVYDKMEQLRAAGTPSGGSVDPANPVMGFSDYVRVGTDGAMTVDTVLPQPAYLRLWKVNASGNPTITVAVFAGLGATTPLELARATGPR